jgi:hypothetical protein
MNEFKEVIKEIMPYLEKVAEQLGTTAQYLWMLQVKQAYVVGISYLLEYLVWAILFFGYYKLCRFMYLKYNGNLFMQNPEYQYVKDDIFTGLGWMVPSGIILVTLFIVISPSIINVVTLLINPEYWALNEVIKLLKGSMKL